MKTNNKLSAYVLRGSTTALFFPCVIVALCSAINPPKQSHNARAARGNAVFGTNAHESRTLNFTERVAYQRAIEDVYWRHRIWPDTNPGPKPPLEAVMSQAQLEKEVADYLCNSQALEDHWQRSITAEQLQTEMDRMAQHTKKPEVLRELFAALGNDPFVIAECLARAVLAEHLIANLSAQRETPGFGSAHTHGLRSISIAATLANGAYTLPNISEGDPLCTDDTWTATSTTNAPVARAYQTAVWTGTEMIVWGGCGDFGCNSLLSTGGKYNPSTDSWTATTATNAPTARQYHTAVWTGTEMIVWGGYNNGSIFNTGGNYNPSTDSWTATSTTDTEPRYRHTAVWTGSEMIVWGGETGPINTGGKYNPSTGSWTATSTTNAPSARSHHTAVWTNTEMIVWGGNGVGGPFNTGGRYNPSTDSWTATSTTNVPEAREDHTAIWSDNEMIVWGGVSFGYWNTGGRYNPSTDSWTATSTVNAPSERAGHTGIWSGDEMIVWGGMVGAGKFNTGGRYNPSTDSWIATSTVNAPDGAWNHSAVWTGSEMTVWGGYDPNSGNDVNTGGRYCAESGTSTPTPTATATATLTPTATPTPCEGRCSPTPRPRPTPAPRP